MCNPAPPLSQVQTVIDTHFPQLRPAAQSGLALWVLGTLLAGSGCQQAVLLALVARLGLGVHALRQRLREWLYDGADRAAPCATSLEVETCFAPLLRWVLSWWQGTDLPLALDATTLGTRLVVLSLSVLYRGTAIPVAWAIFPDRGKGPWMPALTRLLALLAPVVPRAMFVVLMTDCGLWSPMLWRQIRGQGWHPVMRIRPDATFAPAGQHRRPARMLVPGPGHAWVGEGVAYKDPAKQLPCTLLVVWDEGQDDPWLLLTDLPPDDVEGSWYGLRIWVELGFRTLKSLGWDWERTRRTDPDRVARHWLVLAVATLVALAYGTRVEDAVRLGVAPANLRTARTPPPATRPRGSSLFARGRPWLCGHLWQGRLWRRLWLRPEPWPEPPPGLQITLYVPTPESTHT